MRKIHFHPLVSANFILGICSFILFCFFESLHMKVATTVAIYLFFSALFFIIVCAEYMNSLAKEKMPSKILFLAMLSSFGWCAVLLFVNMSVVVASLLTTMVLCISQSTISARRLK